MDFQSGTVNKRPSTQENGRKRIRNQKAFNTTGFKSQYGISHNNNEIRAKQIGFIHTDKKLKEFMNSFSTKSVSGKN